MKKCFASLWNFRSFSYRNNNGYDHLKVGMAIVIQKMVESEV
ncbi:PEP/pyruvate-binding domain-containing protein [Clostridium rectalis]